MKGNNGNDTSWGVNNLLYFEPIIFQPPLSPQPRRGCPKTATSETDLPAIAQQTATLATPSRLCESLPQFPSKQFRARLFRSNGYGGGEEFSDVGFVGALGAWETGMRHGAQIGFDGTVGAAVGEDAAFAHITGGHQSSCKFGC